MIIVKIIFTKHRHFTFTECFNLLEDLDLQQMREELYGYLFYSKTSEYIDDSKDDALIFTLIKLNATYDFFTFHYDDKHFKIVFALPKNILNLEYQPTRITCNE